MKTYIDLLEANSLIIKKDIKGKAYGEVTERVKAFRYVYPQGTIETEMVSNEVFNDKGHKLCIFRAKVFDEDGRLLGTGTAYEKENSSFINNTSYIENCETSAVGRALATAGFSIGTTIMSYEELSNADLQQELLKTITATQLKTLQGLIKQCQERRIAYDNILKEFQVEKLEDLTREQYGKVLVGFKGIMEDENKGEDK